jgi:hypothetical protein
MLHVGHPFGEFNVTATLADRAITRPIEARSNDETPPEGRSVPAVTSPVSTPTTAGPALRCGDRGARSFDGVT